ncbi:pectin lyase-like protein [Tothia fuscella]|uniref:Pectin lyase-like protein n=1 Tax=Tothia fuscella TaxID=1048955 RepID=A0A9P4TV37_9PEZI|nr:pectin lyase-like protein [Tothia fuscella]
MYLTKFALAVSLRALLSSAAPTAAPQEPTSPNGFIAVAPGSTTYWVSNIARNGVVAFGDTSTKVFLNAKTDCRAAGDGSTDDTENLNACIQAAGRCLKGCDSTTVKPAIIYFPPGTYMVSKPIVQPYYTQFIGDALQIPTIKATAGFEGMAVIDADPYEQGVNWYTNQNNFFRQIRNFVIDLTGMPMTQGAGIHWQVAQATSLQNIVFQMVKGGGDQNRQIGIFMDNGSGGFMSDLTFNGGKYGAFFGSQQFTTRNMTFNDVDTAIFMNWNWLWTLKSITVNNCRVGIDMANGPSNQTVGSVILQDSKFTNVQVAVNTSFTANSIPEGGGTLLIDNVDFTGAPIAVMSAGQSVLPGGSVVQAWAQGKTYSGSAGARTQGTITPPNKPASLMQGNAIFERSKPQYEGYPSSAFVSIKSQGAKGDGVTDDTAAIQAAMDKITNDQILYFDHGAYIITSTVKVPKSIKITGEIWPLIMASGQFFSDASNPKPMWQIGQPGDTGNVEISDLIFETMGSVPGAVLMEWNSAGPAGANGMWDSHFRIAGSAGTQLQSDKCSKNPNATHDASPACIGAHTMFHATTTASTLIENCWFWLADHELDLADHNQIDVFNGRGVLIESQGPMWLYGTASEHHVLYNYQFSNAKNIYMGAIQTETPYYQGNPAAPAPFGNSLNALDPKTFTGENNPDNRAWGLRIVDSSDILIYGAGLYSFFDNYGQVCVGEQNCQSKMVSVEGTVSNINLMGLSTKASVSMVSTTSGYTVGNGKSVQQVMVPDTDNRSNFCATVAFWRAE